MIPLNVPAKETHKAGSKNFWQRLSAAQQNQVLVLVCAVLLGAYGIWYSGVYKEIANSENMIGRRENRMETRAADVPQPKNNSATEKQLAGIKAQLERDQRSLQRLEQRFVPADSPEQQQTLRRELSTMANGLGMRVIKLEGALQRSDKVDEAPELNEAAEIDKRYGRPLLVFEVWGTYFALQTLLDELGTLSYTVAPVNLQVTADEPKMSARQALEVQQLLRIEMVLAI